jgi:enhancing lycopene biosynthesis protein 2
MAKPKVAVCLSGCGVFDGSEIHESVFTLLALDEAGAEAVCCAPDVPQAKVVNHLTQKPVGEGRNVLVEAARIARGKIKPIREVRPSDVDALVFPGGFGAAINLCTFAVDGADCTVDPDVEALIAGMLEQHKPIAAICIAPALLARVVGMRRIPANLTIGNDATTAEAIRKMGATHCECPVTEMVVDREHKIVSTPAYMLGKGPAEVYAGIRKCILETLRLIG